MKYLYKNTLLLFALFPVVLVAKQPTAIQHTTKTVTDLLYVFLDNLPRDEFLRNEVNWVSYTRNRQDADVHVQITTEFVLGDAVQVGVYFFGANRFEGQKDTVWYTVYPGENAGSRRDKQLIAYKQGLLPYLLQTDLAEQLDYSPTTPTDTWKPMAINWSQRIWQVGLDGNTTRSNSEGFTGFGGLSKQKTIQDGMRATIQSWKISPRWRQVGSVDFGRTKNTVQTVEGIPFVPDFDNRSLNLSTSFDAVYAIKPRFSIGGTFDASYAKTENSTTGVEPINTEFLGGQIGVGIEHSLFPYKDFFRRRLVVGYYGYAFYDNGQPVPFDRPFVQEVFVNGAVIKRWGFVNASVAVIQTPREIVWDVYTLKSNVNTGINVWRNLLFTVNGDFTLSNDQYANLRSIITTTIPNSRNARFVHFSMRCGFLWTFGSRYPNAVNPRLRGGGLEF